MKYPKPYKNCSKIQQINTYNARGSYCNKLNLPQVRTTHYGLQSIKYKSAKAWNEMKTKISDKLHIGYWSNNRLSKSLKKHYFNNNGSWLF